MFLMGLACQCYRATDTQSIISTHQPRVNPRSMRRANAQARWVTAAYQPSFRRRPESRGGAADSRFRGSDGWDAALYSSSYVARRGMGNYYENRHPPSRNPIPQPLDSGFRRNDGEGAVPSARRFRLAGPITPILTFLRRGGRNCPYPQPLDSGLRPNSYGYAHVLTAWKPTATLAPSGQGKAHTRPMQGICKAHLRAARPAQG